jgi:hypothetical protein
VLGRLEYGHNAKKTVAGTIKRKYKRTLPGGGFFLFKIIEVRVVR